MKVCACLHVRNKDSSELYMWTLVNREGRVCFGFEWAVWEIFPVTCSLDFGYVKVHSWSQGNVCSKPKSNPKSFPLNNNVLYRF